MKRLVQWIPLAALMLAMTTLVACGEEKAPAEGAEEGADTEGGEADPKAEAKAEEPAAGKEGEAAPAAGETPEGKPAAGEEGVKPPPMSPEEEAAVKERCGAAFDNTVAIMQNAGAPANIVSQMRAQRLKTVTNCLAQAKIDPSGARMLDCMIAARLPADVQTCTRKFGGVKPVKPPLPPGVGHDDH